MTYKYEDHSFEIYTGFSTTAGIKITDPENKFYYRNLSQPMLVFLDDFEVPAEGWSDARLT